MKGCLLLAALFVGVLGAGIFWLVSRSGDVVAAVGKALEMPAHVTLENIERAHGEVIDRVEAAAEESDTVFALLAALEKQQWPEELLAIKIDRTDGKSESLTFHPDTAGRTVKIINGVGHGTLRYRNGGKAEFVVIQPVGNWSYLESITLILTDILPRAPEPPGVIGAGAGAGGAGG